MAEGKIKKQRPKVDKKAFSADAKAEFRRLNAKISELKQALKGNKTALQQVQAERDKFLESGGK